MKMIEKFIDTHHVSNLTFRERACNKNLVKDINMFGSMLFKGDDAEGY